MENFEIVLYGSTEMRTIVSGVRDNSVTTVTEKQGVTYASSPFDVPLVATRTSSLGCWPIVKCPCTLSMVDGC